MFLNLIPIAIEILWKGMLTIFIAIGIIYLVILLIRKFKDNDID